MEIVQSRHQFYAYPFIQKLRMQFVKNGLLQNYSYKGTGYYQFLYRVSDFIKLNCLFSMNGDNNLLSVFSLLYPSVDSKAILHTSQNSILNSVAFLKEYIDPERMCCMPLDFFTQNTFAFKVDFLLFTPSEDISFDSLAFYFDSCLPYVHDDTMVLVEDINNSFSTKQFWQDLKKHESITLMIDFYHFGIAFFNTNYQKSLYYTFL